MARIAVIGAGLGAMAAAARLATAGHRVTVYERSATFGGGVRSWERDGFRFDTGPGLLHLPAVYRDLFVKTGREALEDRVGLVRLDPAVRHVFPDGTAVSLPSGSRAGVVGALDAAFGTGAGERWTDLLARARTVWDATRRPLLEEPLTADGVPALRESLARDPYPALRGKGLLRRRTPTLAEAAADELRDPRLVSMLTGCVNSYGLNPEEAPAGAAVLAYVEHTFGTWHVRGGMRALAEALYTRCTERKVDFRFGCEVAQVLEEDGRAVGVKPAGGPDVPADAVVVGTARVPGRAAGDGAPQGVPALSRLTVLLALRGARPAGTAHRTVVHRADAPGRPLTVLRPDDPALRPDDGHEAAVLSVAVEPEEAGGAGEENGLYGQDWKDGQAGQDKASRLADRLLAAADAAGLDLGERVVWREVRTPRHIEEETGAPLGLVPAPALAGRFARAGRTRRDAAVDVRPPNRTGTSGLYRAGGWAHPGGGAAHAGMSGALVAGLIVEGDDWRGSR
ncbi:NAD(P)/FAD-dependent oxidoreductase [Streptomyces sp. WMMB 322]|uniref:phytoene desaturase family protein n=1 Tax=Streptomyces sp. WMMB 322 TaxID=1286821 RepID=UPI0006E321AA|nr:NAD(P)/FAD-dependent oxidoreductase [Streptomyces sp. WMMB 322]SCK24639.1 Phytoene dehydrogenase-related protein [Streptomyces sp. WMMB 322]